MRFLRKNNTKIVDEKAKLRAKKRAERAKKKEQSELKK